MEHTSLYDQLSSSSKEYVDSLSPEMQEYTMETVEQIYDQLLADPSDGEIQLIDFTGDSSKDTNIAVSFGSTEIGSIHIPSGEEDIEVTLLPNVEESLELSRELRDNMQKFNERVAGTVEIEVTDELLKPTPEVTDIGDIAKSTLDKVNEQLSQEGVLDDSFTKKLQEKFMEGVEKEGGTETKIPNLMVVRREKIQDLKGLENKIQDLYDDIKNEISIAGVNGLSPEAQDHINEMSKQIAENTLEAIKTREAIPSMKEALLQPIKEGFEKVKDTISHQMEKIKAALDKKIEAGRNALTEIKGAVGRANERAAAEKDTAYTGLVENVEKVHRGYMSISYSIDQSISKAMEKVHDVMEKAYDRQSEIKGAVQDLGRAITGQERTGEAPGLTDGQRSALTFLESKISEMRIEMENIEKNYEISKAVSIYNINSAQEHRHSVGLDPSKSMADILKDVKERSVAGKQDKAASAPEKNKSEKDKDAGAR